MLWISGLFRLLCGPMHADFKTLINILYRSIVRERERERGRERERERERGGRTYTYCTLNMNPGTAVKQFKAY